MRKVFASYSRENRGALNELNKQLTVLERQGFTDSWDDSEIPIGMEWNRQV